MINEGDYRMWLYDKGIEEETLDRAIFYDKGYAFFRYCIDSGIEDKQTVNLVKFMLSKDVNDTRDMTEEFWNEFTEQYGDKEIRTLLEIADDCINIPALMDFLQSYNNIVICGGYSGECLKEVEIALQALNKPYDSYHEFIYEEQLSEQLKHIKRLIKH